MQTRLNHFLFGVPVVDQIKRWQSELKRECRRLDKEISTISNSILSTKRQVKSLIVNQQLANAKILIKEIIQSNKRIDQLHVAKSKLNSIGLQLNQQLITLKLTGTLAQSVDIIKLSNSLVKLPQLTQTMTNLSSEMMKVGSYILGLYPTTTDHDMRFLQAGIMEEMIQETLQEDEEEEQLEEEAQAEIDAVLFQITDGKLGSNVATPIGTLPVVRLYSLFPVSLSCSFPAQTSGFVLKQLSPPYSTEGQGTHGGRGRRDGQSYSRVVEYVETGYNDLRRGRKLRFTTRISRLGFVLVL